MTDHVKSRASGKTRTYDASGRREKALATRRAITTAAQELLEERGYVATTIADVAEKAGVSAVAVYKGFGTKSALAKAVFDIVIGGDDQPAAVAERPEILRIANEPDVRTKLRLYAESAAVRSARSARIQLALRSGATTDPSVNELWQTIQSERLAGMTGFAQNLTQSAQLRDDISVEEIRDVLWTCISVEIYDLLVLQRGWTGNAYCDWLTRTLIASIV